MNQPLSIALLLARVCVCMLLPCTAFAQTPAAPPPAYVTPPAAPTAAPLNYVPYPPAFQNPYLAQQRALEAQLARAEYEAGELLRTGRPTSAKRRRTLGLIGMALGAAALGSGAVLGLFALAPHSDVKVSHAQRNALIVAGSAGVVALGVGGWAVASSKHNVYADRLHYLRREIRRLRAELMRARQYGGYRGERRAATGLALVTTHGAHVNLTLWF